MNSSEFDKKAVIARLSNVLPALLLPTLLIAFLLCGLNWRAQARPPMQNLMPNPGFETPSPDSWQCEGASPPLCGCIWSGSESHGGDHSAQIYGNASWCNVQWKSDPFTVEAGLPYACSGWIKANNLLDGALLTLAFYSSTSQLDLIEEFDCGEVAGSMDWTQVTTSCIDAPGGAQYARVHCRSRGQGTAWFDDIYVEPCVSPTPVITKSGAPDSVQPGQSLVYTIVYSNTGDGPATDCVITETYDANVDFDDAAPAPKPGSGNRVWEVGTLGPGDSNSIVITVEVSDSVTDGLTLMNLVEMDCDGMDVITATAPTSVSTPGEVFLPLILNCFPFYPLCNGDFESGDFTCWAHGGELDQSVQSEIVHEGNCAALLGNPDYPCGGGVPTGTAWISQGFTVPCCPQPELSFRYRIFSNDILSATQWDSFDVYLNGALITRTGNLDWGQADCSQTWDSGWTTFSRALGVYRGRNVQLSFHNASREDRYYNTWTYVDQVTVTCKP